MNPRLAVTIVAAATLGGAAAGDASATPLASPLQPVGDEPALLLDDQRFGVTAGETWTARFTLVDPERVVDAVTTTTTAASPSTSASTNDSTATTRPDRESTEDEAPAGTVTVAVRSRIDDRSELARITTGDLTPTNDEVELDLLDVLSTGEDGQPVLGVEVPVTERSARDTLTMRAPGIYPVTVTVHIDGDELAEHTTTLQLLPDEPSDDPALGIAVTAALADPGPAPDDEDLQAGRDELEALAAYGDETVAPLTLALPPSLDVILEEDDELSADTRAALEHAELVALPDPTLDPSAAVAIDRDGAFSTAVRRGEDSLARAFPGVPTRRAAWIVLEPLSTDAAAMLRDPLGYRMLVFDEPTYESLPGSIGTFLDSSLAVAVDLGDGDTMPASVVSPLGALLADDAVDGGTPTEDAARILTELLVNREELGAELHRNVVLATADFELPDGPTVAALDRLAAGNPDVHLITLSSFVGTTDTMVVGSDPVTLTLPDVAGPDLAERIGRLDLVRVSAESAASMLTGDEQRDEWLADLDRLMSTGYTDEQVDAALDRVTGEIDAVRGSVDAPEPFTFTLTGRRSDLRLNLRNTSGEPRTVLIRALSSKLRFPAGDQLVTLPPGVTEITIPVEARANGTSSVEIQLLTPVFAQRIGPSTFLEARVNAISGLGQMITGIAVLILLSWWFSHFRRRRKERLAALVIVDEYDPGPGVSPDAAEATAVAATTADDTDSVSEP